MDFLAVCITVVYKLIPNQEKPLVLCCSFKMCNATSVLYMYRLYSICYKRYSSLYIKLMTFMLIWYNSVQVISKYRQFLHILYEKLKWIKQKGKLNVKAFPKMFTNISVNCEMFLVPARCIGLLAGWSLHPHFGFLSLRFYSSTKNPPYPPPPLWIPMQGCRNSVPIH